MTTKIEQKLKSFYKWFKKSKLYYGIIVLVILVNILILPVYGFKSDFEPIMNPIIMSAPDLLIFASPYISLVLMLIAFALYKNKILYIATILLTILNTIVPYVAVIMGSVTDKEIGRIPVILLSWVVFFIIDICIAVYTYKFKKGIYT